jgi:FixJ family two-component response regulator
MPSHPEPGRVCIVDDDDSVRKALSRLFRSAGFSVSAFPGAAAFLARPPDDSPSCLLLDMSMPEIDGLTLQELLARQGSRLPIVFLTGTADVPRTVRAMKGGALDLLAKPVDDADLLRVVEAAIARHAAALAVERETAALRARAETLTPREHQVMSRVISGALNKQIADALGTAEKTVKVHRGRVMEKMGVRSVAELVRLCERLEIAATPV